MHNSTIYEINTRVWCKEFEVRSGVARGLDAVPDDELDSIAACGFDAVWLMGVWSTGAAGRAESLRIESLREEYRSALPDWTDDDVIGSPYAIQQYKVASSLGGDAALERIRRRLDDRGLRLILDFVPNHLGVDHPWVNGYPERFVQGDERALAERPHDFFVSRPGGPILAHGRDPYFPGWTDTAQLDYRIPAVRQAMTEELASIARCCDGVRCDMAMLILSSVFDRTWGDIPPQVAPAEGEFWPRAIESARTVHPDFVFIFEVYWELENQLVELAGGNPGRDFAYDKQLYDALHWGDMGKTQAAIGQDTKQLLWGVRFVENHDEQRAATAFPAERYRAAAVAALTLPGARLIHEGQIDGARIKLPVQLGRRTQEPPDPAIRTFYDSLLPIVTSDTLRFGQWCRLAARREIDSGTGEELPAVFAWQWQRDTEETVVCVANLSDASFAVRLPLKTQHLTGRQTTWQDVLSGAFRVCQGDELVATGLPVQLDGFATQVLVLQ